MGARADYGDAPLIGELARLALAMAADAGRDWLRRRAAERAAKQWAETPATPRGCRRCRTLNYVPGAIRCGACGAELPR